MPWPSLQDCKQCRPLLPFSEAIDIETEAVERGVWGGSLSPPGAAGGTFQYSAAGLCCLLVPLGAAIVAVANAAGMEGLFPAVLSEAGPAAEPSDRASEPHNKWSDASPVTALTAVTMSSCSGLDKQVQSAERCWLSSDANLAYT